MQSTATEKTKTKNNANATTENKTGNKKPAGVSNSSAQNKAGASTTASVQGEKKQGFQKNRRSPNRFKREPHRSEFEQKVIDIRRVTRVVAGGRRFGFRVTVVIGDMKGRVGVGVDKGADTAVAIEKAVNKAKKNMITVDLGEDMTLPHEVCMKYGSSEVLIRPSPGRGIVAGSSTRSVLQMVGVKDVVAKLLSRSGNKLNNARVTIEALRAFEKKSDK